ncbi:MAG: acetyltransferase [Syntrophorhabdaceae bacterium]
MNDGVILVGAGGHAKVVVSTIVESDIKISEVYDDDPHKWGLIFCGKRITGPISNIEDSKASRAIMGIGDNSTRLAIAARFKNVRWATAIHSRAYVHPSVEVGEGTVIFAGAIIQPDTVIGKHCIINTNASIDHDCIIGDYCHIAPASCLAGGISLGEGSFLGIGSIVSIGMNIGAWSIVGAGGVVLESIPSRATAVGIPARIVKRLND